MALTRLAVTRPLTVLMALLGAGHHGRRQLHVPQDRSAAARSASRSSASTRAIPGATAQDVEQLVTQPIENVVAGMPGAVSVTSTSSEGNSSVNVQLADGTDATAAALEVERRVAGIRNRLPADAGDPRVNKADPNSFPIMNVGLTGGALDQLYQVANDQFVPALQSVPGVASVNISGGLATEIQVKLDYAKLAAYGVTVAQISTALTNANVNAPVGTLDQGATTLNVRSLGAFNTLDDLGDLVITQTTTGGPILLRDLATISRGYKQQTQYQRLNGTDAVGLSIVKQSDANALQVADDVRVALRKLQPLLPAESQGGHHQRHVGLHPRLARRHPARPAPVGARSSPACVLLFLHAWRHTVIVLLAIPTSLISTFLVMYIARLQPEHHEPDGPGPDDRHPRRRLHRRHREHPSPPADWAKVHSRAALNGRSEIGLAAIAITLADVVVYTPDRVHQWHHRPTLPPVRSDDRRRDAVLAAHLLHADADARLALAEGRRQDQQQPAPPLRSLVGLALRSTRDLRRPHGAVGDRRALGCADGEPRADRRRGRMVPLGLIPHGIRAARRRQ